MELVGREQPRRPNGCPPHPSKHHSLHEVRCNSLRNQHNLLQSIDHKCGLSDLPTQQVSSKVSMCRWRALGCFLVETVAGCREHTWKWKCQVNNGSRQGAAQGYVRFRLARSTMVALKSALGGRIFSPKGTDLGFVGNLSTRHTAKSVYDAILGKIRPGHGLGN